MTQKLYSKINIYCKKYEQKSKQTKFTENLNHGELSFQQLLTKPIGCEKVITCDIMPLETGAMP